MKILITGATGFIGKELLKVLDQGNHEITVLTRNIETSQFHIPIYCQVYQWNPLVSPLKTKILKGVDAVINLAGENIASKFWTEKRKNELISSRIMTTRRIVQAIQAMHIRPKFFISASAIGFYGNKGNKELNELSQKGNGFLSKICQSWENEIFKCKDLGVRTVSLRLGMVLGNNGGALEKMIPVFKLCGGGRLGNGMQWMSWIHIKDVVNMIVFLMENNAVEGIINAVSPNPIKNKEFTKTLGDFLRRPTIMTIPGFILKFILRDLSDLLLHSQKVSSVKIRNHGFKFQFPIFIDALKEICSHSYHEISIKQWVPQPLGKTFSFFKDAKNLEQLTPKFLNFKILKQSTPEIQSGTEFTYRLSLHGLPIIWKSEIKDWVPNHKFSDTQTKGPYKHWYHTHKFEEKDGGTLIHQLALVYIHNGLGAFLESSV